MNVIYDILNTVIGEIVSHMAKLGENTDSAVRTKKVIIIINIIVNPLNLNPIPNNNPNLNTISNIK